MNIFLSGETPFLIRWYNWSILDSSGIGRPKCCSRNIFNLALFSVKNGMFTETRALQKILWKFEDLLSFVDSVSCTKSCVDFFLLASCIARICFSRPTCCWTVSTIPIANTYILERHVPFPPHHTSAQHIPGGLPFWFQLLTLCNNTSFHYFIIIIQLFKKEE